MVDFDWPERTFFEIRCTVASMLCVQEVSKWSRVAGFLKVCLFPFYFGLGI